MVKRTRSVVFWRVMIVLIIVLFVGGLVYVVAQFSSGAWQLFATQTPTATFTPTPVIPTATLFVPTDTPTLTLTPTRSGPLTYTIVSGDTLFGIAAAYEIDVQTLVAYNNLTTASLVVGQQILIPPPDFKYEPPTVTPIPTGLKPGTIIEHVVQPGEVLSLIAEQYSARLEDIMVVNALTDACNIQVGQVLKIPLYSLTNTPITPTRTPRPTATRRP